MEREYDQILVQAKHCDLTQTDQVEKLSLRIEEYLKLDNLCPELMRAVVGLGECCQELEYGQRNFAIYQEKDLRYKMLGQHKYNINMVPYQAEWKELYEQEAEVLRRALGEKALRIEHIGSTSILGMIAKPVIDIMVAVVSLPQATELIPVIEALGYSYRAPDTVPERMFFAKECAPEVRTHHLNLAEQGSGFWKNQLAFRDYLRAHDQIAAEYGELKQHLAEVYAITQVLDRDGKTEFVTRVLELAEEERKKSN